MKFESNTMSCSMIFKFVNLVLSFEHLELHRKPTRYNYTIFACP